MDYLTLEKKLKRKKLLLVLICTGVVALSAAIIYLGGFVFDSRTGVIIGICIEILSLIFLALCVRIKISTVQVNLQYITLYRFFYSVLYIDGIEQDRLSPLALQKIGLEGKLNDGTAIMVAVSSVSARAVFSNGQPPIDFN